jgi:hypothetical protein
MGIYLTQDCLHNLNLGVLIIKPYSQGINNLKMAFSSIAYVNELSRNSVKKNLYPASLNLRAKHFIAGIALIIPIINILALFILRSSDLHIQKSASKIQAAFRRFNASKTLEKKKSAAVLIQSTFRGWKKRKAYLAKKKAAIKIQSTFRGWRTRKELAKNLLVKTEGEKNGSVKNTGLVPQCLHLLQKTQRLIQRPEVQDLVSKKTKVDIRSATASVDNAKGAVIALCHRKFQISAYLATMAVGHAINATFKLFVPPGVGELERATRYSLG